MVKKNLISFIMIIMILMFLLPSNIFAATKEFTVKVVDTTGSPMSGIKISMRNNYSIASQINKDTDSLGQATFTMYDGITYGFNAYDKNHNGVCYYTPNTYNTNTPVSGLIYTFTLPKSQVTYSIYANPIDSTTYTNINSFYGYRYYNGLEMHAGLDVPAQANTPIKTVLTSYYKDHSFNNARGNWVRFKLFADVYVTSQHLYSVYSGTTSPNTALAPGTTIGGVGSTGDVTGNHLHIEFYSNSTMNQTNTFDPLRHIYRQ